MKKIFSVIIISVVIFMNLGNLVFADNEAELTTIRDNYQDEEKRAGNEAKSNRSYVKEIQGWGFDNFSFFGLSSTKTGEEGAWDLMMNVAKDLKNALIAVAIIYGFMLAFRLFFGQGSEDDIKKWRLGLLWTSIGIAVMQISYTVVNTLFQKDINGDTANSFYEVVLIPIVNIMELSASFIFIGIAILAFYRIISSNGSEDGYKKGVSTIINAVIGFIMIKISKVLVFSIYGKIECTSGVDDCSVGDHNLSGAVSIFARLIQYMTGFVGIISIILIIYAAFLILTSGGDEGKVKKGKSVIKFIFIGIILIASSVGIFYLITGADYTGGFIGGYGK